MDKILLVTVLTTLPGMVTAASADTPSSSINQTQPQKETTMVVTARKSSGQVAANQAGAGFVTPDIELGPLGNRAWADLPYSTNTVSKEMIANQQAQSVSELLKYTSGSQMQARGGMDVGRPQSRGMQGSVAANSRLDGLNIVSTTAFPVEMLERLDVINSLTGALYGPASPAGQFNFVAKRPTAEPLRRVSVGYQNRNAFSGSADLGGHFDHRQRFGYRLNLVDQEGEGNVDDSTLRRKLVSLDLDWNIQSGTQLQLDASHYEFLQKGYVGGFSYGKGIDLPSAPDPKNKNYTLPTTGNDLTTDTLSSRLIHYFNEEWWLTAGVGFQQADRAMRTVSSTLKDNDGTVARSISDSAAAGRFRVLSNTVTLNGHANTGDIGHDLAFSTNGYVWSIYGAKGTSKRYDLGTSNFYHPAPMEEPGNGRIRKNGDRYRSSVNTQQSITVGDSVTFSPQWSTMFYLSQSWLETRSYSKQGSKTGETTAKGLSPNAAVMYKITPSLMAWISYADSLEQGGTAPLGVGVKNEGQSLDPYRSQQYEIGLKKEFSGINLGAALFRLEPLLPMSILLT